MAIQLRRGQYAKFDPSKLLPGEPAVVLGGDPSNALGMAVYICFAAGTVKQLMTAEDLATAIHDKTDAIAEAYTAEIKRATAAAMTAASGANDATTAASTAADAANAAAEDATVAAEQARGAIDPDLRMYMRWVDDEDGDQILALVDTQN